MTEAAPSDGRIAGLDVARGIAVLGIVAMNVGAFAMPLYAYLGPRAYAAPGAAMGGEEAAWLAAYLLVDGKMRGLFALLFGASLLLLTDRVAAAGCDPLRWHGARMALLALFGLAHFYLVWVGDILFAYAVAGLLLTPVRTFPADRLAVLAAGALITGMAFGWPLSPDETVLARSIAEANARELFAYRSYAGGLAFRLGPVAGWPVANLLPGLLEVLAAMLAGMALYRGGALAGGWPRRRLLGWGLAALLAGLAWQAALALWVVAHDFALTATLLATAAPAWPPRLAMATGLLLLVMVWVGRPNGSAAADRRALRALGDAGRMGFSLYVGTSILLTALFYRPDLFGQLSRPVQAGVAGITAALLLAVAALRARSGRRGPLEELWRRGTKAIAS